MERTSVKMHNDGGCGRPLYPAVNVKVHRFDPTDMEVATATDGDTRFSRETLFALPDPMRERAYNDAIDTGWRLIKQCALEIFGPHATVYCVGRSGGWAIVDGLPDVERWAAPDLGRWARFEKACDDIVKVQPYRYVWELYNNEWLPAREEADDAAAVALNRDSLAGPAQVEA